MQDISGLLAAVRSSTSEIGLVYDGIVQGISESFQDVGLICSRSFRFWG